MKQLASDPLELPADIERQDLQVEQIAPPEAVAARLNRGTWRLFVHFSNINQSGYRELHAGQHVRFTFEQPGFLQDGCPFRALEVWPEEPTER